MNQISTTPNEIAKFFRESVSFDFNRETIISYQQIESDPDSFYALIDREAFIALLNDAIGQDNQLVDIFSDLYDVELGIQKFSNKNARNSPRQFVTYFLNQQKYQYHKNAIAKVYIAINTWLAFFGEGEIKPDWSRCPFCGSAVSSGICTNRLCKKTTNDCMSAISELADILLAEKSGKPTATPKYWDDINPGCEFYVEYKNPIELIRQARERERQAEEEKIKQAKLLQAEQTYNSYISKINVESGKDEPDYDSLLEAFIKEPTIVAVSQYKDKLFNKKIEELKDIISKKKSEHLSHKDRKKKEIELKNSITKFLEVSTRLENELSSTVSPIPVLKDLLATADETYSRIIALIGSGLSYPSKHIEDKVNKWGKQNRDIISKFIVNKERRDIALSQQNSLQIKVNELLIEISAATEKDNKAAYFKERIQNEIENNDEYSVLRTEYSSQYKEILLPLREQLAELTQRENEQKLSNFLIDAKKLLDDINKCLPKDKHHSILEKRFKTVFAQYSAIETHADYKRYKNVIQEKLLILSRGENEYFAKKKKRTKAIKITSVVVILALIISFASTFLFELSGSFSFSLFLPSSAIEIIGEEDGENIIVTAASDNYKHISLPEKTRLKWHISSKNVTKIGEKCFYENSSIETIVLPKSIEAIEDYAFANCGSLKSITLKSIAPPEIGENTFTNTNAVFYVPQENYIAYLSDERWSSYSERIFPDFENDYEHCCILFDSSGGSTLAPISTYPINSALHVEISPSKSGYWFVGWYALVDGNKVEYEIGNTIVTNSVKLYAEWVVADYSVKFDYDGGYGEIDEMFFTYLQIYDELPDAHKDGYSFDGWYIGGSKIEAGDIVNLIGNDVAKAKWLPNSYTVEFDYNQGITSTTEKIVIFNSEYGVLPETSRKGYKFVGWLNGKEIITENSIVTTFENHTLIAQWEAIKYIVIINSPDGSPTRQEIDCSYDSQIKYKIPERRGYDFTGLANKDMSFSADDSLCNLTDEENVVIELSANWTIITYQIGYETYGGVNNRSNPENYTVESDEIYFENPSRAGYSFVCWCTDDTLTTEISSIPTNSIGDRMVYAKWQANTNILHFDANGSLGSMDDLQIKTDESIKLPACEFLKTGYSFVGWRITDNIEDGASLPNEAIYTMGPNVEYTLYAVWEEKEYKIEYVLDGGKNSSLNPSSYTINSETVSFHNPSKDGYSFVGWYSNSSLTISISEIQSGTIGDKTIYAKWTANSNQIIFNANGGSGTMTSMSAATNETVTLPANNFYRTGYKFAGWGTNASGASVYVDRAPYTMGTATSYTLYAVWTQTAYIISYNLNGGTNSTANPNGYNSEGGAITLASPTKTGSTFAGWYTESTFTNKITSISSGSSRNYNLYAKWTSNTYTVSYNYDGGSGSPSSKSVTYNASIYNDTVSTYGSLPNANKTGYTFTGWYYADTNTLVTSDSKIVTAGNHTLKAHYSINSYYVYITQSNVTVTVQKYNSSSGTWTTISSGALIEYGTSIKITWSTNSGYHDGWCKCNNANISSGYTTTMPVDGLTITTGATQDSSSCLARGTLITMSDGSQKAIEDINVGDYVLALDHNTGEIVKTKVFYTYYNYGFVDSINLTFSNGATIELVNAGQGLFDITLNRYVLINANTVTEYIGHHFIYVEFINGLATLNSVELTQYHLTQKLMGFFDLATENTMNSIANGFIDCPDTVVGLSNIFDFGVDFTYDPVQLINDIETYGLFTYEEWSEYVSYEDFTLFNGAYLKIAIGKGLLTMDDIYLLITDLLGSRES